MKKQPVNLHSSRFVKIKSNDKFIVEMQYPLLGMKNAISECFVRNEVYEMLSIAQSKLPSGYKIKIWDAWRPFDLQKELYEKYQYEIIKIFHLESASEEKQQQIVKQFTSIPENNRYVAPLHTTGGAVDVTIVDADGNELDMGTGFDYFGAEPETQYFEKHPELNTRARDNRRLLVKIMTESGFVNLPSEWWHYDYGDNQWSHVVDKPILYPGVFTFEEIYQINNF